MAKWKDLPHDVVLQIVECLKFDTRKKQRTVTNKELCEAYLAFQYKTQFVDLQRASRIHVDAILNSPLLPGRYVKTLYLQNFKAIDDLDGIDRATDSLYRIMERSPNVQKVSFTPSRENAAKD